MHSVSLPMRPSTNHEGTQVGEFCVAHRYCLAWLIQLTTTRCGSRERRSIVFHFMFRIVEFANVFWKLFFRAAAHESLIPGWLEFSSVLVMQEENSFPVNDDGVVAVITGRFIVQRKKSFPRQSVPMQKMESVH